MGGALYFYVTSNQNCDGTHQMRVLQLDHSQIIRLGLRAYAPLMRPTLYAFLAISTKVGKFWF